MNNKTPMTPEAAARIQSSADRTNTNSDFKARAQSSAEKNQSVAGNSGAAASSEVPKPQK